jgi:hypothetical protein
MLNGEILELPPRFKSLLTAPLVSNLRNMYLDYLSPDELSDLKKCVWVLFNTKMVSFFIGNNHLQQQANPTILRLPDHHHQHKHITNHPKSQPTMPQPHQLLQSS